MKSREITSRTRNPTVNPGYLRHHSLVPFEVAHPGIVISGRPIHESPPLAAARGRYPYPRATILLYAKPRRRFDPPRARSFTPLVRGLSIDYFPYSESARDSHGNQLERTQDTPIRSGSIVPCAAAPRVDAIVPSLHY